MEVFDLLTALPSSLAAAVLSEYLEVKDVVKTDSAFCNRSSRARLLEVYQSSAVVLAPSLTEFYSVGMLEWLLLRKVKVSTLCVSSALPVAIVLSYLGMTASYLTNIKFASVEDVGELDVMCETLLYHRAQLTSFSLCDTHILSNFKAVLATMTNLRHLVILDPRSTFTADLFEELQCPHIESFQLICFITHELQDDLPMVFRGMSSLTSLTLGGGTLPRAAIKQIAQCVPNLIKLTLIGQVCNESAIVEWATQCPKIVHLDCELTDEALVQIVQILPLLSLRVNSSTGLTRHSLTALATYLSNTLQTLCVANNPRLSRESILNVVQKCTKLKALEFGHEDCPCHELFDKVLIQHLHRLESISVISDAYSFKSKSVALIAQYCTALKHLRINTPAKLNTELHKLVKSCPTLRVLQLNEWNMTRVEEWKEIRPFCTFQDVDSECDITVFGECH